VRIEVPLIGHQLTYRFRWAQKVSSRLAFNCNVDFTNHCGRRTLTGLPKETLFGEVQQSIAKGIDDRVHYKYIIGVAEHALGVGWLVMVVSRTAPKLPGGIN
jgi:hypothetical protein